MKSGWKVGLASAAVTSLFLFGPGLIANAEPDLAASEAAVRKADADWAAAAGAVSVDRWLAFYAADAVVLLPHDSLASGGELVRHSVEHLLAQPHVSVAWHPIKVEIARSGDLAYLMDAYELHFGDAKGAPVSDRGRLIKIWRKQPDGIWKCTLDTWSPNEPAAPSAPTATAPTATATAPAVPAPAVPPATVQGAFPAPGAAAPGPVAPPVEAKPPVTGPLTPAQVQAAKYGEQPTRYKEAIQQYFQEHLKDPNSIQYREITSPEQGYIAAVTGTFLMSETRNYGWKIIATINAKNPRGSYSGFKRYTFLFRGENIVHTLLPLFGDEMK